MKFRHRKVNGILNSLQIELGLEEQPNPASKKYIFLSHISYEMEFHI